MESLNAFETSIPLQGWSSRFFDGLLNEAGGGSGWNQNSAVARRFTLRSPVELPGGKGSSQTSFSILLVEDNMGDAGLVREALEEHGVAGELLVIPDGEKAINYIQTLESQPVNCPDLVILDLNLPRRHGREVLQRMRQSLRCGNATVVILSSSNAQQDKADAINFGASQYIRKPLHLEEFLSLGAVFKAMLEGSR